MRSLITIILTSLLSLPVSAAQVYQTPEQFVSSAFQGKPPAATPLWLNADLKAAAARILGHPPQALRIKYWRQGLQTAWVLDEIGRDEPITAGFRILGGQLQDTQVLIFRESRGWEIHMPNFTRQFAGLTLTPNSGLSGHIDGITGATLSVNAMQRMARLALYLDQHVRNPPVSGP